MIWAGSRTAIDVLVKQSAIDKVRQVFQDNGIQYSVQIDDLQKLIELEAQPSKESTSTNRGSYLSIYNAVYKSYLDQSFNVSQLEQHYK